MAKLELGAGYHSTPGFMTLDLNPETQPDFLGTAYPLPWALCTHVVQNGPFDELRAVDVLEHLSYRDTVSALKEWRSIVEPSARLYVQVPDAATIMTWWFNRDDRLIIRLPPELPRTHLAGVAWRLLGGHLDEDLARGDDDFRLNAHYALFDRANLDAQLEEAGWRTISMITNEHPNICCWAEAI